jgi:hypothetical protein
MQSQALLSVEQVKAQGQITDADVQKLRRAYYADSRIDADEARALIELHRTAATHSPVWTDCLVEMLTDFVVNQSSPEGYVTVEHADWLKANITSDGRVASRAEFELLVNVLDKSRWSPQSLVKFALEQVRDSVVHGVGVLAAPDRPNVAEVNEAEVEVLRRIIYAFGGDSNITITQAEAEILFDINDATVGAANADSWRDLFVKAIANCVLSASGYAVPSREQALARESWLDRRGDLSPARMLSGIFSGYRELSQEAQSIARLERQKVEIITGEGVCLAEASWLANRIGRDGNMSPNELALIQCLKAESPTLHPDLSALVDKLAMAA